MVTSRSSFNNATPLQPHTQRPNLPEGLWGDAARLAAQPRQPPLASKVHPKIVQERFGHSSIAITMDSYSHLMPNIQEGAASAVDDVLRAAINRRSKDVG
jgi:integrase